MFLLELRHRLLGSNLNPWGGIFPSGGRGRGKGKGRGKVRAARKTSFTKIKLIVLVSEVGEFLAA